MQFGRWVSVLIRRKLPQPSTTLKNEDRKFVDMLVIIHQNSGRQFVTFIHRCESLEPHTKIKLYKNQIHGNTCCKNVRISLDYSVFRIRAKNRRYLANDLDCQNFIFT